MNFAAHFETAPYHPSTEADRARIAEETAAFLARGGEITQVPAGMSGINLGVVTGSDNRTRWVDPKHLQQITVAKQTPAESRGSAA